MIKEQQHHPVRGDVLHLDCLEVRLDEEIQAEVAIELDGADQAPGVREGGVLEHVTREVTVEALPTEIPENITVDVSAMEINDTINLASVPIPSGVKLMADDPEEITIATLSPPRVEEEPEPEVEEEAELVGEGEEAPEGEEAAEGEGEGEAAPRARASPAATASPAGSSRWLSSAAGRGALAKAMPVEPRVDALIVGLGNPGERIRGDPAQPRLRGRRGALPSLGAAQGPQALRRTDHRRPHRARWPACRSPPALRPS